MSQQVCIPVGYVLPTAVAISCAGGGVCLSACWDTPPGVGLKTPLGVGLETPQVWAWRTPRCGPGEPPARPLNFPLGWDWRPPWARPLNFPLGVGLETPLARPLKFLPGCGPGNLQSMLGYHPPGDLQGMLGYHSSWKSARHAGIPPAKHAGIPPLPPLGTEWQAHVKT